MHIGGSEPCDRDMRRGYAAVCVRKPATAAAVAAYRMLLKLKGCCCCHSENNVAVLHFHNAIRCVEAVDDANFIDGCVMSVMWPWIIWSSCATGHR